MRVFVQSLPVHSIDKKNDYWPAVCRLVDALSPKGYTHDGPSELRGKGIPHDTGAPSSGRQGLFLKHL